MSFVELEITKPDFKFSKSMSSNTNYYGYKAKECQALRLSRKWGGDGAHL